MSRRHTVQRALVVAAPFLALLLLTKLPSLAFTHGEQDEVIYWTLAERVSHGEPYSLHGAPFINDLSPGVYDQPLFHHPPLYVAFLVPFVRADAKQAAVVISWAGHALAVLSVALVGTCLLGRRYGGAWPLRALALPLLGVTFDPFFTLTGRKLWIDAIAGGLASFGVALAVVAATRGQRRHVWLLAAGLVVGLAGLTKVQALLVLPVAAYAAWTRVAPRRERWIDLACLALPAVLVVLPWFVKFYATFGVLLPTWAAPDDVLKARYPMVAHAAARPWFFFATRAFIEQPLLFVGVAMLALRRRAEVMDPLAVTALVWLVVGLVGATVIGVSSSVQLRFLTPMAAATYLVPLASERWTAEPGAARWQAAAALAIAWALLGSWPYLLDGHADEFIGLAERAGLLPY